MTQPAMSHELLEPREVNLDLSQTIALIDLLGQRQAIVFCQQRPAQYLTLML